MSRPSTVPSARYPLSNRARRGYNCLTMKNKQTGFIVPLILVILALVVAGGAGYVAYQNKAAQSAQVNQENQQFLASTTVNDNVHTNAIQARSASTSSTAWQTYTGDGNSIA